MLKRMRLIPAVSVVAAVATLAGCALAPPPAREEVRAQALPNVTVPPAWTVPGGGQGHGGGDLPEAAAGAHCGHRVRTGAP